jgi:hypothetical protein
MPLSGQEELHRTKARLVGEQGQRTLRRQRDKENFYLHLKSFTIAIQIVILSLATNPIPLS